MQAKSRQILFDTLNRLATAPDDLIDQLYAITRPTRLKKGETFLTAGEVPDRMGFNLNGYFRLYYIDQSGNDWTKGFCMPGNFVVSYSAMVQKRASYFFIEALTDSDILEFSYSEWTSLFEKDMRWYSVVYKIVESVYLLKEMREKSFLLDDAATRYSDFLETYPGLSRYIKLYHIASFIGVTPEALSRIRSQIKNSPEKNQREIDSKLSLH